MFSNNLATVGNQNSAICRTCYSNEHCICVNNAENTIVQQNCLLTNSRQQKVAKSRAENCIAYSCANCDYITHKKNDYNKHIATLKHINQSKAANNTDNILNYFICKCGNKYKDRSGLWKHHKLCLLNTTSSCNDGIDGIDASENFATKSNSELTHAIISLIKHNQEIQSQLLELAKEGRNTIIGNNNNNNTSFNLNVYLNETCKDAINMLDYVNSLNLELSDFEETGKLGYSNGMSRIFINGLKDMDIHKRPIHCSDLKREILYIKEDNVWEKDNENRDGIKNALRKIEQKNIQQIPLWIKAHPNCVISSNRENTPYLKMVMQSTGGQNPEETENMSKIITNIAKAVVINK